MADYAPLFVPGQDFTLQASATITGGQLLAISGSETVAPTGSGTAIGLGVAARDAASGDKVLVRCGGVQRIVASGAVTAGDLLIPAAAGKVSTQAPGTASNYVVGRALNTVADGGTVFVKMEI